MDTQEEHAENLIPAGAMLGTHDHTLDNRNQLHQRFITSSSVFSAIDHMKKYVSSRNEYFSQMKSEQALGKASLFF
jgi:hypothetical protein